MKKDWMIGVIALILVLALTHFTSAETIVLKSGKEVVAEIIERSDDHIKIDISGVSVPFFLDEIESIDGAKISVVPPRNSKLPQPAISKEVTEKQPHSITDGMSGKSYFVRGTQYLNNGQYNQAIDNFQKSIELEPNSSEDYYNLGVAHASLNQLEEAITSFQEALKLDPNHAEASYNLGLTYHILEQPEQALVYYKKAIEINPNYATAYTNLGNLYVSLHQLQQGKESFEKARKLFQEQGDYANIQIIDEILNELSFIYPD